MYAMAGWQGLAARLMKSKGSVKTQTTKFPSSVKTAKTWTEKTLLPLSLDLFNLIFLTGLFIVTAIVCSSTFELEDGIAQAGRKGFELTASYGVGASTGLTIVRVLQGATSYYASVVFTQSLEALQWAVIGNNAGTRRLLTALVLAPSTGVFGLINYICNQSSGHEDHPGKARKCSEHVWQFFRFFRITWNGTTTCLEKWTAVLRMLYVLVIIPLAGLSLFVNVSILPIYTAKPNFNVTAGIGAFNASLVAPIIKTVENSVSYGILSQAGTLIDNPQFSLRADPINCTQNDGAICDSYLFPGGLQTVLPSPTGSDASPFVIVYDSPAVQFGFKRYPNSTASLTGKDCSAYGNGRSAVGVELCIAADNTTPGALQIDLYICPEGVSNGTCLPKGQQPNMSLTASTYRRRATTVSAVANNSIVAVSQLTAPQTIVFSDEDVLGLRDALGWLLNYTAAELPAVSSPTYQLWNSKPGPTEHDWALEVTKTLQNAVAFALWYFTDNNYGNLLFGNATTSATPGAYLPRQFQTTAAFAGSYLGFVVDRPWFIAYAVLQALPIAACWAVLIWFMCTGAERVKASSFPLVDFRYRLQLAEEGAITLRDPGANAEVIAVLDGKLANVI